VLSPGFEDVALAIACAREQFLHGEQPSEPIRDEIFTSWRRSALSGADPDVSSIPYTPDLDFGCRLARAAYPVLGDLTEHLRGTNTAVLLADKDARILSRWAADPELLRTMDRTDSAPGFSLIEQVCGTNGLGSVVEERRALYVRGPEHFAERFVDYACYGAPITNPLTGRLEGVVTLVCNTLEASPLMMPFVQHMSGAIEQRLRSFATLREQALLAAFSKAGQNSRRPVIAVNEKTIITNPSGSRLLEGIEHAVLWEHAAAAIAKRRVTTGVLRLFSGAEATATFRPLVDGVDVLGAICEIETNASVGGAPSPAEPPPRQLAARLRELEGGGSRPWLQALALAERAIRTREPMLLTGEAGTGKLHLATSLHELSASRSSLRVFDAALAPVDGAGVWLRRVKHALEGNGTLVLRHLEALDRRTGLALASVLEDLDDRGERPHVIGLYTSSDGDNRPAGGPHLDRIGVHRISLPPLRERTDDIPELVRRLADQHGHAEVTVTSDAMQALMRCPWPGNVRQLASLMRGVVAGRTRGTIAVADLPSEVIEDRGESFTRYERAEYQAIVQAMKASAGNKKLAAEELGIARSTLYRKLRTYCIDLDRAIF
jgi:transcriptional regulator of acetoin/glycerol metabolism